MKTVTLDTNILPRESKRQKYEDLISEGRKRDFSFAEVTVSKREGSFQAHLTPLDRIPETAFLDQGRFGEMVLASEHSSATFEEILGLITNRSLPKDRSSLTCKEQSQFKDALIFEAHVRQKRDIFVTNDEKAFIKYGRLEKFEERFSTQIFTLEGFWKFLLESPVKEDD